MMGMIQNRLDEFNMCAEMLEINAIELNKWMECIATTLTERAKKSIHKPGVYVFNMSIDEIKD